MTKLANMRDLYEKIVDYPGQNIFNELLLPWVIKSEYYEEFLWQFEDEYPTEAEDRWEFYALLRVLDLLTLRLQPDNKADGASVWPGPQISSEEYSSFAELLGLDLSIPTHYHRFDCEIMSAVKGDQNFHILAHCFPALRLKGLLIKRAGVILTTNQHDAAVNTLNTATIYWASWRKNRKYKDLSQGWGSNSRWRTSPRIDIATDTQLIYNPEGKFDLTTDSLEVVAELVAQELTLAQAIELVTNRHFITPGNIDNDLFPYSFKYEESK